MLRIFKGTEFEFRHRYLTHLVIFLAGFMVPWQSIWPEPHGLRTWLVLSSWISGLGWLGFTASTLTVTALGLFFVVVAAVMRTWGTAYLGAEIMSDAVMHGNAVLADGPYRHVRNPLYVGTWLHTLGLALLMEPAGAVFTVIAIGLVQLRLIGGEEAFLTAKLGEPYLEFCKRVPRLLPSPLARVPAAGRTPHWGSAMLAESYFIAVAVSYAIFAWRFNSMLLSQCVLGSLGVAMIARAFRRPVTTTANALQEENLASDTSIELPILIVRAYISLEVDYLCTDEQLDTARKQLINKWHPDKLGDATEEIKKFANDKLAEINAAYDTVRQYRQQH